MPTKVFLSYNSEDVEAARRITLTLRSTGLDVWFDEWEQRPGTPNQRSIATALANSEAVVILIGASGLGKWQEAEVEIAIAEQVRRHCPVIPAILPGAPDDIDVPLFPRRSTWVKFRGSLDDADAIKLLRWGITGENPYKQDVDTKVAADPPRMDAVADAVSDLTSMMRSGNLTFFLGAGASHGGADRPPSTFEIARELLLHLKLIEPEYDRLLPPVDVAGTCYATELGDINLEDKVVELIANRSSSVPLLHEKLSRLLVVMSRRPPRRLRSAQRPQLVVTTNLDVMMERAFLRAGIAFTRIIQHKSDPIIAINEYRDVVLLEEGKTVQLQAKSSETRRIRVSNIEELDGAIAECGRRVIQYHPDETLGEAENPLSALSLQGMSVPILYKFRGSQDIQDSCVLSTDQYFEFARKLTRQNLIPAQIREIVANTPALFVGYGFFDPDFRLICHVLFRQAHEMKNYQKYAVHGEMEGTTGDVFSQMESRMREKIKLSRLKKWGIMNLDEYGDRFIDRLLESASRGQ